VAADRVTRASSRGLEPGPGRLRTARAQLRSALAIAAVAAVAAVALAFIGYRISRRRRHDHYRGAHRVPWD
jgi:hypothetical protein